MAALNDNRENFTKQLGLKDLQTTVVLNEVRPPLREVFEASKAGLDEVKEANIFEKGAAFIGNKVVRKAEAVKKAWVSVEEGVAPTQYAPIQGEDTFLFIFIRSASLPLFPGCSVALLKEFENLDCYFSSYFTCCDLLL